MRLAATTSALRGLRSRSPVIWASPVLAGLAVALAMPPIAAAPLLLIAFAPLFVMLDGRAARSWLGAGAILGVTVAGATLPALVMWPLGVSVAITAALSAGFGVFLFLAGSLRARLPGPLRDLAPAAAWVLTSIAAEHVARVPLVLSAGMIEHVPGRSFARSGQPASTRWCSSSTRAARPS